ncbi:glyoxalase [Micromonospora phytophila]|uniref:VOC family protein n=1 Tax=Micromonospora phytophila TaxID=709888 RepID=UPI00202E15EC|nr:VOC family protein [Micromonospora phytophila]MCM0675632.1 glyoxalase [Micromonospora phytophila]
MDVADAPVGEMVLGVPDVRLRPFVDRYVGYRERAELPLVRREVAGAFVVVILGWGAPLDVVDPRSVERSAWGVDSFVAGAFDAQVYVAVEDVDAHCARARAAGAEIVREPLDTDYGSRDYTARDLAGNVWSFGTYRP